MTGRIFINYRRGDSQAAAGRLFDRLSLHFPRDRLFMDVDAIEPGVDFVQSIDQQVSSCSAFIAVIGPDWLKVRNAAGGRRLDDPNDYVRLEIEAALKRDIRVIPVLVDGGSMPALTDLPPSIEPLRRRNAMEIAHHRFVADCDDLARAIKRALGIAPEPLPAAPGLMDASHAQQPAAKRLSWAEIVFSFRGRITRLQFLLGLLMMVAVLLALWGAVMIALNAVFAAAADDSKAGIQTLISAFENRLFLILSVMSWWPGWALTLKRLHDIGQGWKLLLVFIAIDLTTATLDFFGKEDASVNFVLFSFGLSAMLAIVKGTSGPNEYGPEPLPRRSKTATG